MREICLSGSNESKFFKCAKIAKAATVAYTDKLPEGVIACIPRSPAGVNSINDQVTAWHLISL
jgi:hypothetical protein